MPSPAKVWQFGLDKLEEDEGLQCDIQFPSRLPHRLAMFEVGVLKLSIRLVWLLIKVSTKSSSLIFFFLFNSGFYIIEPADVKTY